MPVTFELASDLIRNCGITEKYNVAGLLTFAQYDTVYQVKVIGETDPHKLPSDAYNYIKTLFPQGFQHFNNPLARVLNYQIAGINESDDTVDVIVSYVYNQIPIGFGGDSVWTVESDSYTETEETDVQYDPTDPDQKRLIPIKVGNYILDWVNPSLPKPTSITVPGSGVTMTMQEVPYPPAFGLVVSPRGRKRWNYTKQIFSLSAAITFDAATVGYVGRINSAIFTGVNASGISQGLTLPVGTVACMDAGVSYVPYAGQYIARASLVYKPEGWQPWARFSNSILGVPDNLWRAGTDPVTSAPYDANGIIQTTAIPTADLNILLTLI